MEPTSETMFDCTMPAKGNLLIAGLTAHGKTLAALETAANYIRNTEGHVLIKSFDHGVWTMLERMAYHLPNSSEHKFRFQGCAQLPTTKSVAQLAKVAPVLVLVDQLAGVAVEGGGEYPAMLLRLQALEQRYSIPDVCLLATCTTNRRGEPPVTNPKGWEVRVPSREWARPFFAKLRQRVCSADS